MSILGVTLTSGRVAVDDIAAEAELHSAALGFAFDKAVAENLTSKLEAQSAEFKEVLEKRWKVVERINKLSDAEKDSLQVLERLAKQKVADHVQLVVECSSASAMSKVLADSYVGSLRGDDKGRAMLVYDNETAGEALTTPRLRLPPFKQERLKKMVTAVNMTRAGGGAELDEGDLWVLFDGGLAGNRTLMLNQFVNQEGKALSKAVKTLHLHYSEAAMELRYCRVKEGTVLHQLQRVAGHLVAVSARQETPEALPEREHGRHRHGASRRAPG